MNSTSFKKGKKAGPGRPKGLPNKATANARAAIAAFVEKQTPRLTHLLERIEAEEGALAAFRCIQDMVEYHVPKLARTEVTGADGGPQVIKNIYEWGEPQ
jgi:hypothetical protein